MINDLVIFVGVLVFLSPAHSLGTSLTLYTEERSYIMLSDAVPHNYTFWKQECTRIRSIPAVFNSLTELKFIRENEHLMMHGRDFLIGGTTNAAQLENIEYFEYLTTLTGQQQVYVSTFIFNGYPQDYFFQLKSASMSFTTHNILCETDGLSFQSEGRFYKKLVSENSQNFDYWTQKCSEIGVGWMPVIVNSEAELDLIRTSQGLLSDVRTYWLGGSTRVNGDFNFSDYIPRPPESGSRPVLVSTFLGRGRYSSERFNLGVGSSSQLLHGILCENDGLMYQSDTSHYRKLVSQHSTFNYQYWSQKCTELGVGWGPAFAGDEAELEFIKGKQRLLSDNRSFWIGGGVGNLTLSSQGYSSDTHAWLLLTWDADNGYIEAASSPVVRPKSLKTYGILCEDVGVNFVSDNSYYKRLDDPTGLTYQDWEPKCLGLGPGWKTAVLDSATELNAIAANVNELGTGSDYYIGGSTTFTDASAGFGFSDYLPDSSGPYNVYVHKMTDQSNPDHPYYVLKRTDDMPLTSVLCEKIKP